MVIQPYSGSMAEEWDDFVLQRSFTGTFLHTRRFLSYHGTRFEDRSLVLRDGKGGIVALFSAALSPSDSSVVISHPGITYGGVIGGDQCCGETMVLALQAICKHYKDNGLRALQYKAVPFIYHRMPAQDDLYALFRMNAKRYRCDLSATIDLLNRGRVGSRRKRGYKRAVKLGVGVSMSSEYAADLWDVLRQNLKAKHGIKPVHTLAEICLLHERFPNMIRFVVALVEGRVEAGVVLFQTSMVSHAQYIASSETGYGTHALDLVLEHCISEAIDRGARFFDFGNSNEDDGRAINEGLFNFKKEFGSGETVCEFYEIDLEKVNVS